MNEHGLTSREMQVLRLLCEGKNVSQIAQVCKIKERTVAIYINKIKLLFMPETTRVWSDDQLRDYAREYVLPCYEEAK